ncbi:hypothetical protein NSE_0344 [Neorickettsia sennetsu str. Miyayama]|uniref:Uncharacterized protein n=1 Tax=Ehrlichia sennetsu (strain ATCC VR-367 / Miyayama) TaxID=222891 RepID=Q2GE63_EHRS3|nr:hypothetical protein NSE_0344 [Neorickettsia sennetsu str. Miyayama]
MVDKVSMAVISTSRVGMFSRESFSVIPPSRQQWEEILAHVAVRSR